jgi:hypothetical protein
VHPAGGVKTVNSGGQFVGAVWNLQSEADIVETVAMLTISGRYNEMTLSMQRKVEGNRS